jgi:hypothetical protein
MKIVESTPAWVGPKGFPLRAVILECPYNFLASRTGNELTPELVLWTKLLRLKAQGYGKEYAYGVLPMDTADFVGNHIFVCEDRPEGLEPQFGFKSITLQKCQLHHLEFPIFPLIRTALNAQIGKGIEMEVKARLEDALKSGAQVGYNGSFTVHPEMRAKKAEIPFWNMALMLFSQYYLSYGISQVIAGASARFKVDREKVRLGFQYLPFQAIEMEAFNGDPVHVMHLTQFSEEMHQLVQAPGYRELWENRRILKAPLEIELKQAA